MRNEVLDAVERVLARDGVEAVRLDAVAAEAGVSKGGLLHHFPTRHALITGAVERLADRFEAVLPPPGSAPGAYTLAWLEASIPERARPRGGGVHAALLAAVGGPAVLDVLRGRYEVWQRRLADDGIDPAVATLVRMAVDGWWSACLLELSPPDGELHRRTRERLVDLVRDAAAPAAPPAAGGAR